MLLGSAVATHLEKGFLAIRKAGHLCVETQTEKYIDYSGRDKLLEVRVDALKPGTEIQHTTKSKPTGLSLSLTKIAAFQSPCM